MRVIRWWSIVLAMLTIGGVAQAQTFVILLNQGPSNNGGSLSESHSGPTSGVFSAAEWVLTDTSFAGTINGWYWNRELGPNSSGDPFGRLVARFSGDGGTASGSYWRLPANRSGGVTSNNPTGVVTFTTWVGSGHRFRLEQLSNKPAFGGDLTTRTRAQFNNAAAVSSSANPVGSVAGVPDDDPILPGVQVNKQINPLLTLNWSVSAASAFRGQVASGPYFGAINSPFRDDIRVTGAFKVNGITVQTGNSNIVTFAVNEGATTKSTSAFGNTYSLDLSPYNIGDIVTLRVEYSFLWDGYHDAFAGTATLFSGFTELQFEVVPEPGGWLAISTAVVGLVGLQRRRSAVT